MAMPLDLVLVRHGESVGNAAIRDAKEGRPAPPPDQQHSSRRWLLTERGKAQAAAAGAWLRENRLEKMTVTEFIELAEGAAEGIPNGGILNYTCRNPHDSSEVSTKFGWVRLVDPSGKGGFNWRRIKRRIFDNAKLAEMAEEEGTQVVGP